MEQMAKKTDYWQMMEQLAADQIYFFLEEVSVQICDIYASGQSFVMKEIDSVTAVVQKSEIVNFYVLYKIFKDTSTICKQRLIGEMEEGMFRHIESEVLEEFAHYIIEKYEILKMEVGDEESPRKRIPITQRILNSNKVRWR